MLKTAERCVLATLFCLGTLVAFPAGAQSSASVLPKGTVPSLKGVVSGSVIVNAPIPTATGSTLVIQQFNPQVIIDWNTFNVATGSIVQFIQPSSTASALNRIFSADPSVIQGKIVANGQIFLINQNGILFDRGTQINVNTLYASSLNITNAQFLAGVVPASSSTPSFSGGYDINGNPVAAVPNGAIQIGTGGSPSAAVPKLTSASGGAIVLLAPMINNQSGIITSPDGQVILAAGNQAYLQFPDASDVTLRGLVVEINAASGPVNITSMVTNMGTLSADRGNVTLAALAVNQGGTISASTALQKDGSIYLQAVNQAGTQAGTVNLLPGSVLATPLDTTDTSTLPVSQSYDNDRAQVQISGATIIDQGTIRSPAGVVTITAQNPADPTAARVYLASNSVIDVSGDTTTAPLSDQLLTFKVTSNELANSPDQKTGILKGATVTVDLDAGSTLLDLSAYQSAVEQNLQEKAISAGSVALTSGGSVIQRLGSVINANAGSIAYQGGKDPVTLLLGSDNKIYSITSAPEALTYTAVLGTFAVDHPHWGLVDSYTDPLLGLSSTVAPYTAGGVAGSVSVFPGAGLVLDGQITASTTIGTSQLASAPASGSLTLGQYNPNPGAAQDFGIKNIVVQNGTADTLGTAFTATTPLTEAQLNTTRLSSDLFSGSSQQANGDYVQTGFQQIAIGADGDIVIPKGVTVAAALGGSLTMRGQQISVGGDIAIPAGSVALDSVTTVAPLAAGTGYRVQIDGAVSVAGLWSNSVGTNGFGAIAEPSTIAAQGSTAAITTANGGSIAASLPSGVVDVPSTVVLSEGSVLDVSAGGSINKSGKISGGNGGSISLASANSTSGFDRSLVLDGTLEGYGFAKGASLSLATQDATIGDRVAGSDAFTPSFFTSGGFSSYTIAATNGVTIDDGTAIDPTQQNFVLAQTAAAVLPSGANVGAAATVETLPSYSRAATSIALSAPLGGLTLPATSSIKVDPGGSVSLSAGTGGMLVAGQVEAPGGTVKLSIANSANESSVLTLAPSASVNVAGTYIAAAPNLLGIATGTVLGGGTVSITTTNANLMADAGSVIDVSGAAQVQGMTQLVTQKPLISSVYSTNAGDVNLTANDAVTFNSTLLGHATGESAGGTFSINYTNRNDLTDSGTQRRVILTDAPSTAAANATFTDAAIALNPLHAGGFDKISVTAEDVIQFDGPSVDANFARGVTLDTQQISIANGTQAEVGGAAVALSNTFGQRIPNGQGTGSVLDNTLPSLPIASVAGTGDLTVAAQTLDLIGSVTISGTKNTVLASSGDTRLTGRVVGVADDETGAVLTGGLTTAGNLTMQSSALYPTTRSIFTIAVADGLTGILTPGGQITFEGNSSPKDAVLSAGGSLTVNADRIVQAGTVEAPLGTLDLNAVTALDLAAGSTTSTSGHGQIIPYGGTSAGVSWLYASTNDQPLYNALTGPPVKSMSLTGQSVQIDKGATVDLSGGGNILGIEFVPGSGGSTDALAAPNTYAIIPASLLATAPVDTAIATIQNLGFSNSSSVYNSIHIATGGVVPAGDYALLPGYYALVPGAYLVQVQTGTKYSGLQPGQSVSLANGLNIVPAWEDVAGTSIRSSQTIGIVVQPGSNANKLADYNQFSASFFTQVAAASDQPLPVVPNDAGQLTLAASQRLVIDGRLVTTPGSPTGNSAEIDITGKDIAVVDSVGQADVPTGYLEIAASSLSSIDGSILLGGTRTSSASAVTVLPDASAILIANSDSSPLAAPELLLASTGSITMLPGSVVLGEGAQIASARNILIDATSTASGAFIRASNSAPVAVTRGAPPDSSAGIVTIDAGATLGATGSVLIDATGNTVSEGRFALSANAGLSLVSSTINLGDAPAGSGGLTLDQSQLSALTLLGSLTLKSYGDIDVYGSGVVLGAASLASLSLDSEGLVGRAGPQGSAASMIATASNITLENTSGTSYAQSSTLSGGALTIDASQVSIASGSKSISGFSTVTIAANHVQAAGVGQLDVGAPLTLTTSLFNAASGANQGVVAADLNAAGTPNYYDITISSPGGQAPNLALATGLGGQIALEGADIVTEGKSSAGVGVNLIANAGAISLSAVGGGMGPGVEIGSGTIIDTSGRAQSFAGTVAVASAGSVTLFADHGSVDLAPGSTVSVAGASAGGDAGSLSLTGPNVAFNGAALNGHANQGQQQGSFALDTGALSDVSTIIAAADSGGFTQSFDLRVRSGSIVLAANDDLVARNVLISADNGSIILGAACSMCATPGPGAIIDASSPAGSGSVMLNGAAGVSLLNGSLIDAAGESTNAALAAPLVNGGKVAIATATGTVTFSPQAVIDVSAGATGTPGTVSFTAPRDAVNGVDVDLEGTVLSKSYGNAGAAEIDVYGSKVYTVGSTLFASVPAGPPGTPPSLATIIADNQSFMASTDGSVVGGLIKGDGGALIGSVNIRPDVQIVTPGNLTLDATDTGNIDLTDTTSWLLASKNSTTLESGTLTLRAGGTLTVSDVSIGLPDNNLHAGNTWNINLVGGADLSAANVMQTQSLTALGTTGSVVLDGPTARITSGSGNIKIAAGYDFLIDNPLGVVYTSGVPVPGTSDAFDRWAEGGGDITITAQHDATGSSAEWLGDWYRRTASGITGDLGSWWTYRSNFEEGVGALGGGNVVIAAGDDVIDLSVAVPTSGRITSPNPLTITHGRSTILGPGPFYLDVEGGGDLSVTAGSDIVGGQYLVSLGVGDIKAGGTVGAQGQYTQLYLMGENQTASRQAATINVTAGGSVNLQSINDPTLLAQPQSIGADPSIKPNNYTAVAFASYSPDSAVNVQAKGGNVFVYGAPTPEVPLNSFDAQNGSTFGDPSTTIEWPAQVSLVAFNGGVSSRVSQTYVTYPTPIGKIQVLTDAGVDSVNLVQSDLGAPGSGPTAISNWLNPINSSAVVPSTSTGLLTQFTAGTPFVDDIVALNGAITNSTFKFPAVSRVYAGTNIDNVQLELQNDDQADVSEIIADTGFFHPSVGGTSIAGPGQLLVQAGGTIDLGTGSAGTPALVATGNTLNDSLADANSARITIVAGVTGLIDLANLDTSFATLIDAGENKDAALAQSAASALFGGDTITGGNINTYLTSVQTDHGSGIDLIAPDGNITVGLTTPPSSTTTIGIVTNAGGAIRSYLSGDFSINQGKVLTALGGDIEIYTTEGNIDAGRGAKTSLTIPPPTREPIFNASGVITGYDYVVSSAAAGSGIQTVTSNANDTGDKAPPAGNIYLFAPAGDINAGEAGIVSGGNLFVEANLIVNPSGFSSAGSSVGVPQVVSGSLASSLAASGSSSTAGSDKAAADAARAASAAAAGADVFGASVLTVEVLGFGANQCKETDKQCLGEPQ